MLRVNLFTLTFADHSVLYLYSCFHPYSHLRFDRSSGHLSTVWPFTCVHYNLCRLFPTRTWGLTGPAVTCLHCDLSPVYTITFAGYSVLAPEVRPVQPVDPGHGGGGAAGGRHSLQVSTTVRHIIFFMSTLKLLAWNKKNNWITSDILCRIFDTQCSIPLKMFLD